MRNPNEILVEDIWRLTQAVGTMLIHQRPSHSVVPGIDQPWSAAYQRECNEAHVLLLKLRPHLESWLQSHDYPPEFLESIRDIVTRLYHRWGRDDSETRALIDSLSAFAVAPLGQIFREVVPPDFNSYDDE